MATWGARMNDRLRYLPEAIRKVQPVVLFGARAYALSRTADGAAGFLAGPFDGVKPLRPLCGLRTLNEHARRAGQDAYRQLVLDEAARKSQDQVGDPLVYFLTYLVPAVQRWDRDSLAESPAAAPTDGPTLPDRLEAIIGRFPEPRYPSPSLFLFDRFWLLAPMAVKRGRLRIELAGETYAMTGQFLTSGQLQAAWQKMVASRVAAWVDKAVGSSSAAPRCDPAVLHEMHRRLRQDGCLEFGDLVFVAGDPPRVGCILGEHYSHSLSRQCRRDVAITSPLTLPLPERPVLAPDGILEKPSGRWERASLPHGLCLGGAFSPRQPFQTRALRWVGELRWACERVRSTGRFHEAD